MYSGKPSQGIQTTIWLTILCTGFTFVNTNNFPALSQPTNSQPAATPTAAIQSIRQTIKKQFGISKITIVSITEQQWPDGCLGLARGQEACTAMIIPGWRIEVTDNLQTWVYRTDQTGKTLRLENPDRPILPQAVANKLIQQIARETNTPSTKLRISAVQAKFFDYNKCMGSYHYLHTCTIIANKRSKSWQAIVTSPNQTYVYYVNQNASQIEITQNKTASGAQRKIRVSAETFGEISPRDGNEVFSSSSSGDFTGRMFRTVLTQDGKITRYQSSPTAKFAPVVIKTLSPKQVNAFKTTLDDYQFFNFNGLTYLTSAVLADYPTTTYQSQLATTQFIDLEKQSLPRSLQKVIASWESLITTVQ
jgi:hypothetical protein